MMIQYLPERPAGAAFMAGPGKPAGTEVTLATVIVRTAFDLVAAGSHHTMAPATDAARHEVVFSDAGNLIIGDPDDKEDDIFDLTYEADIALEKSHAEVVVLGFVGAAPVTGSVTVGGSAWQTRNTPALVPGEPADIGRNLFGWHKKSEAFRSISDATSPGNLLPDAYAPHFNNVHRRSAGFSTTVTDAGLPAGATVTISRTPGAPADYTLSLPDPLALRARYFTYCGHGEDVLKRWNPGPPSDLIPDTLIVDPDADEAVIIWRGGWTFTDQPTDLYRSLQIVEGDF